MKTLLSIVVLMSVLTSCGNSNKEYNSYMDLPDNVYESIILSFPDAKGDEILDLYHVYSDELDTLENDEVILLSK